MSILVSPHEAELAYYNNPFKRLVIIALSNHYVDGALLNQSALTNTLDQQVIYRINRTNYFAIYKGLNKMPTSKFDLDRIKPWIDDLNITVGKIRAIAYSTRDAKTLKDVFWSDSPLNNTGGIYGHDTREPKSDYVFPKELPPGTGIAEHEFNAMATEVCSLPMASAVRWTDTIPACQIANTVISLSSDTKLLSMDDLLIKL